MSCLEASPRIDWQQINGVAVNRLPVLVWRNSGRRKFFVGILPRTCRKPLDDHVKERKCEVFATSKMYIYLIHKIDPVNVQKNRLKRRLFISKSHSTRIGCITVRHRAALRTNEHATFCRTLERSSHHGESNANSSRLNCNCNITLNR